MLAGFARNEKRPESRDRDNDDSYGGLSLQPEYHPCRIHLAVAIVTAGDADDGCDYREDAEAKDTPKCELTFYANAYLPE